MGKKLNLIGEKYGRLKIINEYGRNKHKKVLWLCECECGNVITAASSSLTTGNTKSCGCLQKEHASRIWKKTFTTHGLSKDENGKKTRLFRIWTGIKTRCYNVKDKAYPRYGGRGITLCEEWMDFKMFHGWAKISGYKNPLTIERKDNEKGYFPNNCTWIPKADQAKNRRNTKQKEEAP